MAVTKYKQEIFTGEADFFSTSLTWTVCFPLQTNNRGTYSRSLTTACLKPDAAPPSSGMIQGLKYERNFVITITLLKCVITF